MNNKKWIPGILGGLVFFLFIYFIRGAASFSEVVDRLRYFFDTLHANPQFLIIALALGVFVGIIFWIIKNFGEKENDSKRQWAVRIILVFLIIFVLVFVLIKSLDILANQVWY